MNDRGAIYNSRITKVYLEYLNRYYPHIDVDSALENAGMTKYEVEDKGHWFSQEQVDCFHETLVKETENPNISREAGRYSVSSAGLGTLKQYTLGLMSLSSVYLLAGKVYGVMSRGATVGARKLGPHKVEIVSTPKPGVNEKPFQCENRIGTLEAIGKLFTDSFAQIEHPSCFHRGDESCRYLITWHMSSSLIRKRIRNYSFLIGLLVVLSLFFFLPIMLWIDLVLYSASLTMILSLYSDYVDKKELTQTIKNQMDAAEEQLDEVNIRYNNALLIQEIGQAISNVLDVDQLIATVLTVIEKRLDFDRGMIMLANQEKTRLIYQSGYGYDLEVEGLLRNADFHLDNPRSRGLAVMTFKQQRPFLVNDISEIEKTFSERSQDFVRKLGIKSLICVPILYEKETLGLLCVDNIHSKRPLTQSDVNLLMGVAAQTAVSITNAMSFQKLRESEEKFHDFFENVSDFLYFHDLEGYFTETNLPFKTEYGYTQGELANLNVRDLIPDRYKHQFDYYLKEVMEKGESEGLMRVVAGDGRERIVEYRNSLVSESGKPIGVRGLARDITDRINAETALRKSEEKYRSILESIEEGYFEVDIAGNFTFFNDSLCKIWGYSGEELLGKNNRDYTSAETSKKIYRAFNQIYRTGKPGRIIDYEIIRKDGTMRVLEASASLIRDPSSQPVGFRGVVRDVTEQKHAEEEKRKLEAQLQQARKMEAIGTLAGGVAHDLNNILSGLVSYPELLLMDLPQDSPLRKPVLTIQKSGERAAGVVQDLLTLARRGVAATEVVNLNDIIFEYLKSPEHDNLRMYHTGVQVETRLETHLLNISGSPVHLSKTLMNLVSNAAEAMSGGGKILISTENRYIDRPIRGHEDLKEGDYVTLAVSDTGVGISEEDVERIFEPFYTKKEMGRSGTGLGMAVVWATVNDHKGYIDVQTRVGEGTTFTLYFPATRQELTRQKTALSIERYMGRGQSILVVDDVQEQREIASRMLKRLGYAVISVSSGEEAISYMRDNSADLLILDMIMDPGIDGLETYKKIIQLHPGQRAIIASGFSETGRVKEAQRLGAGPYVKKPYTLEKLGTAIKAQLGK